jgi:hypothetical protein
VENMVYLQEIHLLIDLLGDVTDLRWKLARRLSVHYADIKISSHIESSVW